MAMISNFTNPQGFMFPAQTSGKSDPGMNPEKQQKLLQYMQRFLGNPQARFGKAEGGIAGFAQGGLSSVSSGDQQEDYDTSTGRSTADQTQNISFQDFISSENRDAMATELGSLVGSGDALSLSGGAKSLAGLALSLATGVNPSLVSHVANMVNTATKDKTPTTLPPTTLPPEIPEESEDKDPTPEPGLGYGLNFPGAITGAFAYPGANPSTVGTNTGFAVNDYDDDDVDLDISATTGVAGTTMSSDEFSMDNTAGDAAADAAAEDADMGFGEGSDWARGGGISSLEGPGYMSGGDILSMGAKTLGTIALTPYMGPWAAAGTSSLAVDTVSGKDTDQALANAATAALLSYGTGQLLDNKTLGTETGGPNAGLLDRNFGPSIGVTDAGVSPNVSAQSLADSNAAKAAQEELAARIARREAIAKSPEVMEYPSEVAIRRKAEQDHWDKYWTSQRAKTIPDIQTAGRTLEVPTSVPEGGISDTIQISDPRQIEVRKLAPLKHKPYTVTDRYTGDTHTFTNQNAIKSAKEIDSYERNYAERYGEPIYSRKFNSLGDTYNEAFMLEDLAREFKSRGVATSIDQPASPFEPEMIKAPFTSQNFLEPVQTMQAGTYPELVNPNIAGWRAPDISRTGTGRLTVGDPTPIKTSLGKLPEDYRLGDNTKGLARGWREEDLAIDVGGNPQGTELPSWRDRQLSKLYGTSNRELLSGGLGSLGASYMDYTMRPEEEEEREEFKMGKLRFDRERTPEDPDRFFGPGRYTRLYNKGGEIPNVNPDDFVIPADVVSNIGDGSSAYGAERLTTELGMTGLNTGGIGGLAQRPGNPSSVSGIIRGPGSGLDDHIQTTIGGKKAARLSDFEFVVPKQDVAELGDGSVRKGQEMLYSLLDNVRKEKHGTTRQPAPLNTPLRRLMG